MAYENNENKMESIYSQRIRAGKRRTYFFDVRTTKGNDYYLTITESRKRFNDDGYDRHKIFLYKEDFNKFTKALGEVVDYVKTELMPDFDFDAFNHDTPMSENGENGSPVTQAEITGDQKTEVENNTPAPEASAPESSDNGTNEEVDKW